MKFKCLFYVCLSAAAFSAGASAETGSSAAEVFISPQLFNEFQISGSGTSNAPQHGFPTKTNLNLSGSIQPIYSANSINLQISLNLGGSAHTQATQNFKLLRQNTVTIDSTNSLSAGASKTIGLSGNGVVSSPVSSYANIQNTSTTAANTAGTRGIVGRTRIGQKINAKANETAIATAKAKSAQYLPADKARMESEIKESLNSAVTGPEAQIRAALQKAGALPLQSLSQNYASSFSGNPNGKISWGLTSLVKTVGAKPTPETNGQEITSIAVNEELLNDIMRAQLVEKDAQQNTVGKTMNLEALIQMFCASPYPPVRALCTPEAMEGAKDLQVQFDKNDPIKFTFDKGKMTVSLNARYLKLKVNDSRGERLAKATPLFQDADPKKVLLDTGFYRTNWTYKVDAKGLKFEDLVVHEVGAPDEKASENKAGLNLADIGTSLLGLGTHGPGDGKKETAARKTNSGLFSASSAIKSTLEQTYKKFNNKKEVNFPNISFPTKFRADGVAPGAKPNITATDYASLLPMESKTENGWFTLSTQLCTPTKQGLGLITSYVTGGRLLVDGTKPGSSAQLAGLQTGDIITGYAAHEGVKTAIGGSDDEAIAFMRNAGQGSTGVERTVKFWVTRNGQSFEKSVTACPRNYPHAEKAQEFMNSVKS